jgi:hypothetical protein
METVKIVMGNTTKELTYHKFKMILLHAQADMITDWHKAEAIGRLDLAKQHKELQKFTEELENNLYDYLVEA